MSDTTPRPDETPGDPTAPAQPADVEVTEFVPVAESVPPSRHTGGTARPATQPAQQYAGPQQPQYAQQQYAQPAAAAARRTAPAPGTAVAPPEPDVADRRAHLGHDRARRHAGRHDPVRRHAGLRRAPWSSTSLYKDRGPFVHHHSANALNVQIFGAILVIGGIILTVTVIGAIIGIPMIIVGGLLRADRAHHRRHQGQQRRVVEPADDAPVRQVSRPR